MLCPLRWGSPSHWSSFRASENGLSSTTYPRRCRACPWRSSRPVFWPWHSWGLLDWYSLQGEFSPEGAAESRETTFRRSFSDNSAGRESKEMFFRLKGACTGRALPDETAFRSGIGVPVVFVWPHEAHFERCIAGGSFHIDAQVVTEIEFISVAGVLDGQVVGLPFEAAEGIAFHVHHSRRRILRLRRVEITAGFHTYGQGRPAGRYRVLSPAGCLSSAWPSGRERLYSLYG